MPKLTKSYERCARSLFEARDALVTNGDVAKAKAIVRRYGTGVGDTIFMRGVVETVRLWAAAHPATPISPEPEPALTKAQVARNAAYFKRSAARTVELEARKDAAWATLKGMADKMVAYDRIVELLDKWHLDGVALGDCTKERLTTEAAKLQGAAETAVKHAVVYRKAASKLQPGQTLRQAGNRLAILDIIRGLVE